MEDLTVLARRALELMDAGRLDEWAQTMDPDCEFIAPGAALRGRRAVRFFVEGFRTAFPDVHHAIDRLYVVGDAVIMEGTFGGTHSGPIRSPAGELPATHRKFELKQAQVVQVRNGLALSLRTYFDRMELMTQLGLLPFPSAPASR
jgi:predicted ester cyclase